MSCRPRTSTASSPGSTPTAGTTTRRRGATRVSTSRARPASASPSTSSRRSRERRSRSHVRATVSLPIPYRARTGLPSTSSTSTQSGPRAPCATCHARSLPQHRRRAQQGGHAPPGCAPSQRFPPRRIDYATGGQTSAWSRTDERSRRSTHRPWPTTTPWPGAPPGAGAVCERASRSSSARCPPVISKAPAAATIPPTTTTDHYLSDTSPVYPRRRYSLRNATPSVLLEFRSYAAAAAQARA